MVSLISLRQRVHVVAEQRARVGVGAEIQIATGACRALPWSRAAGRDGRW